MQQAHVWLLMLILVFAPSLGVASDQVNGVRMFLSNGDPEQAVASSKSLLRQASLDDSERFELLYLIVEAEEMRSKARHYGKIASVITAIENLEEAFPSKVKHVELLWRKAWLHWNHGDEKQALQEAQRLRGNYPAEPEAVQAAMLMGRIYIKQRKFNDARSSLIQYGLDAKKGSREEALTYAWMSIVDAAENRNKQSLLQFQRVYKSYPAIIKKNEQLFSSFIKVLHQSQRDVDALKKIELFLEIYLSGEYVPSMRLLRADLWHKLGVMKLARIEQAYSFLADRQAERRIGKQAFMRNLMLKHQETKDYRSLKPVIIAFKRLANQNQLSPVENEALYNLAILWQRLSHSDIEYAPRQSAIVSLDHFYRLANSDIEVFRKGAKSKGRSFFENYLSELLEAEKWAEMVAMWERFPRFRSAALQSLPLQMGVAHAMRVLMAYEQSEKLLTKLYQRSEGSVQGQQVMLERARLWLDREDKHGATRAMQWLDDNEFTLYRPEMLLLVVRMQLQAGHATEASRKMRLISSEDISREDRGEYWRTKALLAEALEHWTDAAKAWKYYGVLPGSDAKKVLLYRANDLFKGKRYSQAEGLYKKVDEADRDAAWRYRYSICQLKTGQPGVALERLGVLKQDAKAGVYATLAALALADRQAEQLLKEMQ